MSRARLVAAALAGGLVLAGCGAGQGEAGSSRTTTPMGNPSASTPPPTGTAGTPTPTPTATGAAGPSGTPAKPGTVIQAACMKPYAVGNESRGLGVISGASAAQAKKVSGMVAEAHWNQLEPGTPGRYDTAVLDKRISYAKAAHLTVRIRVTAGVFAPDYVKKLGGSPIPFYDHQQRKATTIGRFWRTDYQARWQALMSYLASRYDTDPTVREVNI